MDYDEPVSEAPYGPDHPLEKMLSVKGTRMLLPFVHEHPGGTRKDVRDGIFGGKRRDRAFEAVIGYGAVAEDSGKKLWPTEKGEFFARLFARMREAAEENEYTDLRDVDELGLRGHRRRNAAGRADLGCIRLGQTESVGQQQ